MTKRPFDAATASLYPNRILDRADVRRYPPEAPKAPMMPVHRPIATLALGMGIIFRGMAGEIIGARVTKNGARYLVARMTDGRIIGVEAHPSDWPLPVKFDIRLKQFDFGAAPDLTGTGAFYFAALADGDKIERSEKRFTHAKLAAIEAARLDYERGGHRRAYVGCEFDGERPGGAMRGLAYVSYRPRRK